MLLRDIPRYHQERRDRLMAKHPGAMFIFPSAQELLRNPDVTFPFRQESNFFYLTGFEEPEAILVLAPADKGSKDYRTILFVRERNPERELWDGERYGVEGAKAHFHIDEAYPITDFDSKIQGYIKTAAKVFYRVGLDETMDRRMFGHLEAVRKSFGRSGFGLLGLEDPGAVVGEMRLFKDKHEVEFLRRAGQISGKAHAQAMKETKPGMNEGEIQAVIEYHFRRGGCRRLGYDSIVAGGKNACCLHYRSNNDGLHDGDLFLIDAGGEYEYYTADITRTFPVGKKFTPAQARIYDLVLKVQKECIAMAKPGVRFHDIHDHACKGLTQGLIDLGLLKGTVQENIESQAFRRLYPHNTGHWLGMDVHDVGLYRTGSQSRVLEPGMVFTIEPGLYFQTYDQEVPEEYKGIGIRIEDNILITENGCENLTVSAPKERAEIESLRA